MADPLQTEVGSKPDEAPIDDFHINLSSCPNYRAPSNPQSWSFSRRCWVTTVCALLVFNATLASVAPNAFIPHISADFGASATLGTCVLCLMVAGYCIGPVIWGPLSEEIGRKPVFVWTILPYTVLQAGCALSPSMTCLLVLRFLSGCFAAAPISNCGAIIADIWSTEHRGTAMSILTLSPFAGPAVGPIVGAALLSANLHWSWVFWLQTAMGAVCSIMVVLLLPETHHLTVDERAQGMLRTDDRTENRKVSSALQTFLKACQIIGMTLKKASQMAWQEPILLAITVYMAFVYGILYLLFTAIPVVFTQIHEWSHLETASVFLALLLGGVLSTALYALYFNRRYMAMVVEVAPLRVPPEMRLYPLMLAAPVFAGSIFWFGFTSYQTIFPAAPIAAIALLGFCITWMFAAMQNYIVDTYVQVAASALSVATVVRSLFGAVFPLVGLRMYTELTPPQASAILASVAFAFIPLPFLFIKYGRSLRGYSRSAVIQEESVAGPSWLRLRKSQSKV